LKKNVLIGRTTGQERAVLYMLAGGTGLRRKELLNLGWDDINLGGENAHVRVKASIANNDKEARQPIPEFVVRLLKVVKAVTRPKPADRVFVSFGQLINTAGLIRADLEAAGIRLVDRDGNEICFHSLPNSYISYIANSQTPPKVVQKLARHSDPRLTFNTYARSFAEAERTAIAFLPNVGTFVLETCLDKSGRNREILRHTETRKPREYRKNRYFGS
jgi:integrase